MSKHIDNTTHCSWYDPVTLSGTCTYVNVKEGCTGTIADCNFVEIGENNTGLSIEDTDYCTVGRDNTNISIAESEYVIVGDSNINIEIGSHSGTSLTGTGGASITVGFRNAASEVTGERQEIGESRSVAMDGAFNQAHSSDMVLLDGSTGNGVYNSRRIEVIATDNCRIETPNLTLDRRDSFLDYAMIGKSMRVKGMVRRFDRESDASGTILDYQSQRLINVADGESPKGGSPAPTAKYSIVDGLWTLFDPAN